MQPPIVNYVDIPVDYNFPYDFISRDVFHVEYYDGGQTFMIYRPVKGIDFHIFDLNLRGLTLGLPETWKFSETVREAPKEAILFLKDTSEMEISQDNHMAVKFSDGSFAIVIFEKSLKLRSVFYVDTKITGATTVKFYKKKLYLLKSDSLHILGFPNGFNMPFQEEKMSFQREYNDFTIDRHGVFLFIRGYSDLIASESPNPEKSTKTRSFSHSFKHGRFIDSKFGTFILRYTEHQFGAPKYFAQSPHLS